MFLCCPVSGNSQQGSCAHPGCAGLESWYTYKKESKALRAPCSENEIGVTVGEWKLLCLEPSVRETSYDSFGREEKKIKPCKN
jgi:hypothetical protein